MVYAGMSSRAKEGKKVLELQLWRKELRRKRFDAVSERLERLELREEHNEKAQKRQVSIQGGGFESRPQLQREKAKNTSSNGNLERTCSTKDSRAEKLEFIMEKKPPDKSA